MLKQTPGLVALLLCLFTMSVAYGQTAPAAGQDIYAVINYLKIAPQNTAAYEEMVNKTIRQFYIEAMKQPGTNLMGWSMSRVVYRGVDDDAPTHIGVAYYLGPPPGGPEGRAQAIIKKVTGAGYDEYQKKIYAIREVLGNELVRGSMWGGATPEGSYRVTTYAKAAPSMLREVRDEAARIWKPVYDEAIKDGSILSYASATHVFPRGEGMAYDIVTSVGFKDLPSAVRGFAVTPERLAKVHKDMSYLSTIDGWRDKVTVKRVIVARVLAVVNAPAK